MLLLVGATLNGETFTHSQYVSLKTKDAIVDRFREKSGERPNVDLRFPDLKIDIHIDRHFCTVSLDSSGESLHKRGYKVATNIAPINEVLAARNNPVNIIQPKKHKYNRQIYKYRALGSVKIA